LPFWLAQNMPFSAARRYKVLATSNICCRRFPWTALIHNVSISQDAALERRFQQVMVEPPSVLETVSILRGLREK
jgi:hypothetical protein